MTIFTAVVACLVVLADARVRTMVRDEDLASWDYPILEENDLDNCLYNCNSAIDPRNRCVEGQCACAQGFNGKYCTCEGLCDDPFGTCNNDASGTCTCSPDWKGRNCNCPTTCPDSHNWRCKTGDTVEERGCICKVDSQPWVLGKKCCPNQCSGLMSCPLDDGVCHCPTTNTNITYGSSPDKYKCCSTHCKETKDGGLCECRTNGCFVKATGLRALAESDCTVQNPGICTTHDSWQECSIVHWQGRCQCDPLKGCRCKCWYGWAGGEGKYELPGWETGYKALYSDHCRNRCDWTHSYQPAYCSSCQGVACPECNPEGSKKCVGST